MTKAVDILKAIGWPRRSTDNIQPEHNATTVMCVGKERFASTDAARSALRRMTKRSRKIEKAAQMKLGVFRCRFCQCWHVGHEQV